MSGRRHHDTLVECDPDWTADREARIARLSVRVGQELAERKERRNAPAAASTPAPPPPPVASAPPPPPVPRPLPPLHKHPNGQWYTTRRVDGRKLFYYFGTDKAAAEAAYEAARDDLPAAGRKGKVMTRDAATVAAVPAADFVPPPTRREPAAEAAAVQWPGGLARLWPDPDRVREEWARVVVALENPDLELTAEEFAPVLAAFNAMVSIGHTFDPALVAIVRILERQATGGEEDGDADDADRMLSEENSSWAVHAERLAGGGNER